MRKLLSTLAIVFVLGTAVNVKAEVYDVTANGSYILQDNDSKQVAEDRALLLAKRDAIEKAGVFIQSYSEVKNSLLSRDEISCLASGNIQVEEVAYSLVNGVESATVRAKVNTDSITDQKNRLGLKVYAEAKGWFICGMERYTGMEYGSAKHYFTKALEIYPDFAPAYAVMAQICEREGTGHYDEGIDLINKAIQIDSTNAHYYNTLWYLLNAEKRYGEALAACTTAILLSPGNSSYYSNRGITEVRMKNYDLAMADYTTAIVLKPTSYNAYNDRAILNEKIGNISDAVNDYRKYLQFADLSDKNIYSVREKLKQYDSI